MCTNRRYITNKYTGKTLLVDCGHCPSCLQKKANKRLSKLLASKADGYTSLFCTFTYNKWTVPYISITDLITYTAGLDNSCIASVPIYRDYSTRIVRGSADYKMKLKYCKNDQKQIDDFFFQVSDFKATKHLQTLCIDIRNCQRILSDDKVGILYLPDIQNFFKRVKISCKRKYGISDKFEYFYCSEYGSRSSRPHFHAIVRVPSSEVELYRKALADNWQYANLYDSRESIQIASSSETYVSSYVNCYTSLPPLLCSAQCSPRARFSRHFGFHNKSFSYQNVVDGFYNNNLTYDYETVRQGVPTIVTSPLPQFVLDRYFPKFKGFSRLNAHALANALSEPRQFLPYYWKKLGLPFEEKEVDAVVNRLHRSAILANNNGVMISEWIYIYSQIHAQYSSQLLINWYKSQSFDNVKDLEYDNIVDVFNSATSVRAPTLTHLLINHSVNEFNYNSLPYVVYETNDLTEKFFKLDKKLKYKNSILCYNHISF